MNDTRNVEWFCTERGCRRPAAWLPLLALGHAHLPRLRRDTWIRYGLDLATLGPRPSGVHLTPIDAGLMEALRLHPEREEPQVRSAFRFWQCGFGDGYLWLDRGEPLCMIWLLQPHHMAARAGLGAWAGIYAPLPQGTGVVEGIYSFRRGLRRTGGVATTLTQALFHRARDRGLRELRTHVHQDNLAARRWAARVDWQPIGAIHRCFFDLPLLRRRPFYLHQAGGPAAEAETAARTHRPRAAGTLQK